jgi:hypothetical protein
MQAVTIDKFQISDPINLVDPSGKSSQYLQALINASYGCNEPQRVMNTIKNAAKTVGYIAGAGATVGTLAVVGPPLLAAAAPKVVGLALAGTIAYNAGMIGVGQYIARNPNFLSNTHDFVSNLITGGSSDAPTNLYGMAGAGLNYVYDKYIQAGRFTSDNFNNLGNSGFDRFSNSGDYDLGGSSSNSNDYWSSNPYQ